MPMHLLVDGNNLMFAMAEVAVDADRVQLAKMLAVFARREGLSAAVVFDGRAPRLGGGEVDSAAEIDVRYSGTRQADDVLAELIDVDSAPRQLLVISSDRQVQRHARRRRCKIMDSVAFARLLKAPPRKSEPDEPAAKTRGLAAGQLDTWLKEFGLGSIIEDDGEN